MRERKRLRSVLQGLTLSVDTNSVGTMVSIQPNRDNRHHLSCPNQRFVGGFLAVNDVVAGLGGHADFDAPWGSVGVSAAARHINWPSDSTRKVSRCGNTVFNGGGLYPKR
jgi:hypothetical protein